ncbi:exodeoxyribonuclease V subunit alpha [Candidatus Palibaumannia cicadellinicola]|uniref:RecBCD enzyme subunit RecD n=1 Tax=Candidatus Palibaumannia cicadellinicola TaxID=186490 RepID=A0A0K2BM12_9GAMM|nr:exodeoxyribonuclease V subunit alpha [Candidatus Baumannia cicadellinicola]AKZ66078.1 Exodeoxyribonuclease V alpha chain [Candidatus Baumannia cicadellinicola]
MEEIIIQAQKLNLWRPLDIYFARMIAAASSPDYYSQALLLLASACLSADIGVGHVCLPLSRLTKNYLFEGRYPKLSMQIFQKIGHPNMETWHNVLLKSPSVSDGLYSTPLVLDNNMLYLHRLWQYECTIANFFNRPLMIINNQINYKLVSTVLDSIFSKNNHNHIMNWQKIAIAIAITSKVALISGGPGTGKTNTLAKLLVALLLINTDSTNYSARLRIIITTPNSQMISRLREYIMLSMNNLILDNSLRNKIVYQIMSIPRLLGVLPNSKRMRYNCDNKLNVDILIIDDASMIDLQMMANIINAIPNQTKVIFFGDYYQLASVETGAVFRDICKFADTSGYSEIRSQYLVSLTSCRKIFYRSENNYRQNKIADIFCCLRTNYRFKDSSGISHLANAIKAGNIKDTIALLNSIKYPEINYIPRSNKNDYKNMVDDFVTGYQYYLKLVHQGKSHHKILEYFNKYRILAVLREGQFGVNNLNSSIEHALICYGLIKKTISFSCYVGQPIIIMRNSPLLELYNGDIGIVLLDSKHTRLLAYFPLYDGTIKTVPINCLPKYETAFTITVHQSIGSEFTNTALVLPDNILPVLTRELLYTGVTRACKNLSIYAPHNKEVLVHTINSTINRRSGLKEKLLIIE